MSELKSTVVDTIRHTLNELVDERVLTRESEQLRMTNDVRNILLSGSHPVAVCDAGFGLERVWASMLAALPVAQSQGKRLIIATGSTVSLSHMVDVVLPALMSAYPEPISFSVFQQPDAFICKEKLLNAMTCCDEEEDDELLTAMHEALLAGDWDGRWSHWQGPSLSLSKQRALSAGQSCQGERHGNCPYCMQSRLDVDIVVTDHKALCDALSGVSSMLPSPEQAVWIIDDAHLWGDSTQAVMSATFSLDELEAFVSGESCSLLPSECVVTIKETVSSIHAFFQQHFNQTLSGGRVTQGFERGVLPKTLLSLLSRLLQTLNVCHDALAQSLNACSDIALCRHVDSASDWLNEVSACLLAYLTPWDEKCHAKWFSYVGSTDGNVQFFTRLVNVSALFYRALWSQPHGGVVLSASSLTMLEDKASFLSAVGLNFPRSCFWRHYASPIDFSAHGELLIPDVPFEPTSEHFKEWLKSSLFSFCEGFQSTLVLFASAGQMYAHRAVWEATFTQHRTLIQCEGDAANKVLCANHKRALANGFKSVVFATFDGLEALDIQGEHLENVVIVKLPFPVIGTPFAASINEVEVMQGRNPFESVVLPTVYRRLAQAMGRLLPTATKTGRCVMLDTRFTTTEFGWQLLQALPPLLRK